MALLSFRVENNKSVKLAEVDGVPPVMVIAGPNGIGKSTLLFAIKNGAGKLDAVPTKILYQGPHRVLRRTNVQRRWLGGGVKWLADLISGGGDVSGYEGLSFQNSQRTPDNVDEAGSTIKHTLGKIENQRQSILASIVDRRREEGTALNVGELSDVYEPLRTLTKFLLPHLLFSKMDFTTEDNIRCLWKRTDSIGSRELDIDDLSSGEKSIIVLFLPLLEDQIREHLDSLTNYAHSATAQRNHEDRVVLIDEPEQHLHPDLQAKLLSYIRNTSRNTRVQFIITTHSPTILDQAYDSELYALLPPSSDAVENQLRRIASSAERLETLKELTGGAYFLTTGRIVVCIEGETPTSPNDVTDLGLLEAMYPRATAFTLVPTRGKGNVIQTVNSLRSHIPEEMFRIRVRGLVDTDRSEETVTGIETLPVCMIENLLLDSSAIFEMMRSLGSERFAAVNNVSDEIQKIIVSLRDEEIALRMRKKIRTWTVRIGGHSIAELKKQHTDAIERVQNILPSDAELQKQLDLISSEVDQLISDGQAIDRFRGKSILKEFYRLHVTQWNIGYKEMCIDISKRIGKTDTVTHRLNPIFDKLAS